MNDTDLYEPETNEPKECCVPGCTNVGPTSICFEHLPPSRFEADYDPNEDHGDDERRYQQGF
jgi:hypothetical protein